MEHFYELCDTHLPPNLLMVVKIMLKCPNDNLKVYTHTIKQLALIIFFYSTCVCTFLKTMQFPSLRTLRRVTEKIEIIPGLNDVLFEAMVFKINNLKDDAKDCVLTMDEMTVKTNLFYNLSKDYIIGSITRMIKTYEQGRP